jgi:hypothetical protein
MQTQQATSRRFIVRPSLPTDAALMLSYARHEDRNEWDISVPGGLEDHLESSISYCSVHGEALAVEERETGRIMMLAGAQPQAFKPDMILSWMVLAEGCEQWGLVFMKDYAEDLQGFFDRWPRTECFSDARNTIHHRWLTYVGYEHCGIVPWGPFSLPFIHFKKGF